MANFREIVSCGCRHFRIKTVCAYSSSHFAEAIDDTELSIEAHPLKTVGFEIFLLYKPTLVFGLTLLSTKITLKIDSSYLNQPEKYPKV